MLRRLLLLSWSLLTLVGCQPYLDHEQSLFDFRAGVADFGPKRQLELTSMVADQNSLLLVFNQPLHRPGDGSMLPFEVNISPPAEEARTEFEGVAGVRVTFTTPLAASSEYVVDIPAGWRALTGVALLRPIRRSFRTVLPELSSVKVQGQSEPPSPGRPSRLSQGQTLELLFNQPVAMGSVLAALTWQPLGKPPGLWRLEAVQNELGEKDHKNFLLRPGPLLENTTYRLAVGPGVKGLEGPLRGEGSTDFLFDCHRILSYKGALSLPRESKVALEFSSPVTPQELARCLVTVPTGARPSALKPDPSRPGRIVLDFPQDPPSRLLLLAGLESSEYHRLEEQVSIELVRPSSAAPEASSMAMVPIPLNGRILTGAAGKGRLTSWPLSLDQALAASLTPEATWTGAAPLPWEGPKPAFTAAAKDGTVVPKGAKSGGFLAVRRNAPDGSVKRGLAVGTDLHLAAISTPLGAGVKVRSLRSGRPLAGCSLNLRGPVSGSGYGPAVKTDANGEALVPWGAVQRRPDPLFLVASLGKDQTFTPLAPAPEPPLNRLPEGFMVTDQAFYGSGQEVVVSGFLWKKPDSAIDSAPRLTLRKENGETVRATYATVTEKGFLEARCLAPEQAGLYSLELEMPDQRSSLVGPPTRAHFRVCPVAQEGESYTLALDQSEDGAFTATLSREGARHRRVGLRAYLLPLPTQGSEVQGWTPLMGQAPAWSPLSDSLTEELNFQIPDLAGGGILVAEAFDPDEPSLVLARTQQDLAATQPSLALSFEQRQIGPGQQEVTPMVVGWSGEPPEISAALMVRTSASSWQEAEVRPSIVEPWSLTFQRPGEYRLLVRATLPGGPVLEAAWEREVTSKELADPGLTVEPKVAMPGATLLPALPAKDAGAEVWLRIFGVDGRQGRFVTVGPEGALPPLTIDFARSLAVTISTDEPVSPEWGRQWAKWRSKTTPVPLGPLSRQANMSLSVEREDRVKAIPRPGQNLRVAIERNGPGGGWSGALLCSATLPGWPAPEPPLLESFLGQSDPGQSAPRLRPESYPLLPEPNGFAATVRSGLALEQAAEAVLPAPAQPGIYRWWAIARDDLGRFAWAQTTAEIGEISRWSAFTPWGARAGDSFDAGIKFVSGPAESGALGLTATALVGGKRLSPSGYLRTAGVVKGGETYILDFSYELGLEVKDQVQLAWELGHGGKRHQQDAVVSIFETSPVPRGSGVAIVATNAVNRVPVPGALPWRLSLHSPQQAGLESTVGLRGPRGSLGQVRLRDGAPPVTLQGAGPGTVEITHLGGPPVTYEMFRLEPDLGTTQPWASRVYLFRRLVDQNGQASDVAVLGNSYKVRIDLVNPAQLDMAHIRLPLPGGLRPLALTPARAGSPSPAWKTGPGQVEFDLRQLPAGEFLWELEVEATNVGDYLWPAAQATTADGALQAISGSRRLVVQAK